jgi:hypothetical protein
MAVGRISGPLLKDNLLRNGVNLAFETNLLYLDVVNSRVGINTANPAYDLDVNGTTRTTNLYASNSATIGTITLSGSTISSSNSTINLTPNGTNAVVYQGTVLVGNLSLTGNTLSSTNTNGDINVTANGTGGINLGNGAGNVQVTVTGNLHATGNITADGNITLGNAATDTVTFDAEINSSIIPNANNTYDLGSPSLTWANLYTNSVSATALTTSSFTATGTLSVSGTSTLSGDTSIGSTSANTLNVVAGINSNLIPAATNSYSLGTSSYYWNNAYISTINTAGMQITGNSITSTGTNSDLQLSANGTGTVYIPTSDLTVTHNATIGGTLGVTGTTTLADVGITGTLTQTGDFTQTGNFNTSGNLTVTGNITASGAFTIDQITISGSTITTNTGSLDLYLTAAGVGNVVVESLQFNTNTITATGSNTNINLTPQATGSVIINNNTSLVIPVGTTVQRPTGANGMIRYNTTNSRYEGYANGYWTNLGGVQSIDGNTRITPELNPGTGDNVIRFYANNVLTAYIDSTKLYANDFQTNNLDISNNTISAITPNTDINFTTSGTGGVVLGNLRFTSNTITNVSSNAVTTFNQSGSGYVKVAGTYGMVVPVGNNSNYPALLYTETGMVRYNTDVQYVEVYNGTSWVSVAGAATGVSANQATDIALGIVLSLG